MLMEHFGLSNMEQLLRVLGDDFRYVEPVYCGPELRDVSRRQRRGLLRRALQVRPVRGGQVPGSLLPALRRRQLAWKTWTARTFPRADWFDYSTIRHQAEALREQGFAVCCGTAGDMDFINGIARARGMEQVLMDLIDDSPVYLEIMQARFEFFYEMQRRMLEAAGGLIDFAHVGDDFGNQRGPMIGLPIFERHFAAEVRQVLRDGPLPRRPDDDAHVRLRGEVPAAADRVGAGRVRRGAADHARDGHRRPARSGSATG